MTLRELIASLMVGGVIAAHKEDRIHPWKIGEQRILGWTKAIALHFDLLPEPDEETDDAEDE